MITARCAKGAIEYRDERAPEWLRLLWECNSICKDEGDDSMFGRPSEISEWWAGGTVEEYEHARVIHREDPTVSIVSKTDHGSEILKKAAVKLGIKVNPVISYMKLAEKEES